MYLSPKKPDRKRMSPAQIEARKRRLLNPAQDKVNAWIKEIKLEVEKEKKKHVS